MFRVCPHISAAHFRRCKRLQRSYCRADVASFMGLEDPWAAKIVTQRMLHTTQKAHNFIGKSPSTRPRGNVMREGRGLRTRCIKTWIRDRISTSQVCLLGTSSRHFLVFTFLRWRDICSWCHWRHITGTPSRRWIYFLRDDSLNYRHALLLYFVSFYATFSNFLQCLLKLFTTLPNPRRVLFPCINK